MDLVLEASLVGLDAGAHEVLLADGARVAFWTAADRHRQHPPQAAGHRALRQRPRAADARRMLARCAPRSARERAWSSSAPGSSARRSPRQPRRAGAEVTIIEAAESPLAAVLGTGLGEWFARLHREEGIEVLLSAQIARLHGTHAVEAVELGDGRRIAATRSSSGSARSPPPRGCRAAGWTSVVSSSMRQGVPRSPACLRPGTPVGRSTRGCGLTFVASTGRPHGARAPPPHARCSGWRPPRRPSQASGATSTACASSTSATRTAPTGCRSTATPRHATSPRPSPRTIARSRR